MKLTLKSITPEVDNIFTFTFGYEKPIVWQAGQYMHYNFEHQDPDERGIERYFTIAAPPFEQNIKITTRYAEGLQSSFKQALKKLSPGDSVEADGPNGDFVISELNKKYILIAGGIGITPYYSILKQLEHEGKNINADLLYLSRDQNMVFLDDFEKMQEKNKAFCVHAFADDKRLTDDELKGFTDIEGSIVYISGPKSMVGYYRDKLQEIGLKEDRLKVDFFPGYQNA